MIFSYNLKYIYNTKIRKKFSLSEEDATDEKISKYLKLYYFILFYFINFNINFSRPIVGI